VASETITGYIKCASCGARIRADRERCLRCGDPLRPAPAPQAPLQIAGVTLRNPSALVGALVVLVFVGIAVLAYWLRSAPPADVVRSPAAPSSAAAPASGLIRPRVTSSPASVPRPAAAGEPSTDELRDRKESLERALAENPSSADVLDQLGQLALRTGDLNGAIARFSRAADLAPETWAYRFNLAGALAEARQWDRAIVAYRRAATLAPRDVTTVRRLAEVLRQKGDDEGAIAAYEQAVELSPADAGLRLGIAMALERVGRRADAGRQYERYLELNPGAPGGDRLRAHIRELTASP
jgi:cytochrome c-type biogenesis protein CcmH/NrfG